MNVQERQWVHGAWAKPRGGEELPVQLVYERVLSGLMGGVGKAFWTASLHGQGGNTTLEAREVPRCQKLCYFCPDTKTASS